MRKIRQAFIIDGVVSESATKQKADNLFRANGEHTKIHYHSATAEDCNDRCVDWPPLPSE